MFSFFKMQGTGNDFIVVNCIEENHFEYSFEVLSKFLCDRHYGVGADGVIFIYKSDIADFKMKIFNSDGTEAEMCGNGIRCLAKYVYEKNLINKREFTVETLAGIKKIKLEFENKKITNIKVDMGEIEIENLKNIIEIKNIQYKVYPISIGNPHAVCFVKNIDNFNVKEIGSYLENYKYFPNKTNVEFVEILDRKNIKLRVWERGVGETNSCGTGACAASLISIYAKNIENHVNVELKGGKLEINYNRNNNHIELIGPAENIFEGRIENM